MPAATNRGDLLDVTDREFTKLRRLLDDVDDIALEPDEDGVSVKDIVAHRAHWIHLFLGWYRDGLAGETVAFPAPGYKWNDLARYNADLRASQADLGWDAALDELDDAHDELRSFLEGLTDDELYGGPMRGANNRWTPGRWAEAAGPSHYRSAAKFVRGRRRALTTHPE